MKFLRLKSLKTDGSSSPIIMQWNLDKYPSSKELLENAYLKIDSILICFDKDTLHSQLNDMQIEVTYAQNESFDKCGCFKSKYTIPLYFINLVLKQHNLKLEYGD